MNLPDGCSAFRELKNAEGSPLVVVTAEDSFLVLTASGWKPAALKLGSFKRPAHEGLRQPGRHQYLSVATDKRYENLTAAVVLKVVRHGHPPDSAMAISYADGNPMNLSLANLVWKPFEEMGARMYQHQVPERVYLALRAAYLESPTRQTFLSGCTTFGLSESTAKAILGSWGVFTGLGTNLLKSNPLPE